MTDQSVKEEPSNAVVYAEAVKQTVESGHGTVTSQDLQNAALIALLQEQIRGEREARERAEVRASQQQLEKEKTARNANTTKAATDCCCCLGTTAAVVGTALIAANAMER